MHWRLESGIRNYLARIAAEVDVVEAWAIGGRSSNDVEVALVVAGGFDEASLQRHVAKAHLETGVVVSPYPIPIDEWHEPSRHRHPRLIHAIGAEGIQIAGAGSGMVEISSKSSGIKAQRDAAPSPLAILA
jgi:hypothetical protein